jgi:hypothetical protein
MLDTCRKWESKVFLFSLFFYVFTAQKLFFCYYINICAEGAEF